ncbi:MAG: DUF5615 family PIN-like protein [Dehalococcoidia bacterium]
MQPLLADENFKDNVLAQLRRRLGDFDLLTATDLGLRSTPDPIVLIRAAELGRVVLTHDGKTVIPAAYERVRRRLLMPGAVFVPWSLPIGRAVSDLEVIIGCGFASDFENQVLRVPY